MKIVTEALSESSDTSCMRLMAFISLIVAALIAFITLFKGTDLNTSMPTIAVFVGGSFGGKMGQKYMEGSEG